MIAPVTGTRSKAPTPWAKTSLGKWNDLWLHHWCPLHLWRLSTKIKHKVARIITLMLSMSVKPSSQNALHFHTSSFHILPNHKHIIFDFFIKSTGNSFTPSSSLLFTLLSWRPGASPPLCRPLSRASTVPPLVWSTPSAPRLGRILGNLQTTPPGSRRSGSGKKEVRILNDGGRHLYEKESGNMWLTR